MQTNVVKNNLAKNKTFIRTTDVLASPEKCFKDTIKSNNFLIPCCPRSKKSSIKLLDQ